MQLVVRSLSLLAVAITAPSSAPAQGVTATTHVVITGGPRAGSYDTQATRAGCSMDVAGKGVFGVQISDSKGQPFKFNSVQLSVPKPSATGSSEFALMVAFGPIMKRTGEYNVDTRSTEKKPSGHGTVIVMGADGANPTAKFDATTADGIHIAGIVSCNSVVRP
jgi:hypothetical protein